MERRPDPGPVLVEPGREPARDLDPDPDRVRPGRPDRMACRACRAGDRLKRRRRPSLRTNP
jgi:hypothetical protein